MWADMRHQLKKGAKRFDQNSDETQSKRTIALYMDLSKSGNLVQWKDLGTNIIDLTIIVFR